MDIKQNEGFPAEYMVFITWGIMFAEYALKIIDTHLYEKQTKMTGDKLQQAKIELNKWQNVVATF